jgi:hypothetical protein
MVSVLFLKKPLARGLPDHWSKGMTWKILVINTCFVYSIIWFIWNVVMIRNDYQKTLIYDFFQKITLYCGILHFFARTFFR